MIYADNAATTKPYKEVLAVYSKISTELYANPSAMHDSGIKAKKALEKARWNIKEMLGGGSGELIFTSGGTESNNHGLRIAAAKCKAKGRTHIVASAFEHPSVLRVLENLAEDGFQIQFVRPDAEGYICPQAIEKAITPYTGIVSVMYANNIVGTIQPVAEIGAICKERGIIFHCDGVQAVGHIDIDLERDNIDIFSFSAHKFGGVKGVGGLWVRDCIKIPPLILGGGQENGYRSGTEDVAGIVAMSRALALSLENLTDKNERLRSQVSLLRSLLNLARLNFSIHGGDKNKLPHFLNISFDGIEGSTLQTMLSSEGVMVSTGAACSSATQSKDRTLQSMGVPQHEIDGAIRITLSPQTTAADIHRIAASINAAILGLEYGIKYNRFCL